METGCFTRYLVLRLLDTDESDEPTYAIQYFTKSIEDYKKYINKYAAALGKSQLIDGEMHSLLFAQFWRLCNRCAKIK